MKLTPKEQKLLILLAFLLILGVVLRYVLPTEQDLALQQELAENPATGIDAEAGEMSGAPAVEAAGTVAAVQAGDTEKMIVIHMAGAVKRPGVYHLPAGSRVYQLLDAAGGALEDGDLERINLAQPLVDGKQIYLPRKGEEKFIQSAEIGAATSGLVNINTANQAQLESLPGIGAVKAGNIINYRQEQGPFQSIEELLEVSGIGDKTLAGLRDHVTVW